MPEATPTSAEIGQEAGGSNALPYRIAVLCYLHDSQGRLLMLHRSKAPNKGRYSPIGGKLEVGLGEGPHECARREIQEEAGLDIDPSDIEFIGMVSEKGYEDEGHWLMFCFDITRTIEHDELPTYEFDEGVLEWVEPDKIESLNIPDTDRQVLWPLVRNRKPGNVFTVHIDCSVDPMTWVVHASGS